MDLKELFFLAKTKNILEEHNLSYNFFTEPIKMLTEEECLHEILLTLYKNDIIFPINDSSDVFDMIEGKTRFDDFYHTIAIHENEKVFVPFIKKNISISPFIHLLCFMKSYASHTYTHKGSFKEYFKDVFQVFYDVKQL